MSNVVVRRVVASALVVVLLAAGCSSDKKSETGSASSSASASGAPRKGANPGDESAGDPSQAGYTPTGPLVADNGFRPEIDGFAFENYGKGEPPRVNMGPNEMRKLFGDAVCADAKSGKCDLIPPAEQWMDQANKSTEGGHCQGFSVLSGLLWKKLEQANTFGGATTPELAIDSNEPLQREIAYAFMFQTLDAYNKAIVKGTPNDILDKLLEVLKPDNPDSYTIGIYKPGFQGGHAVTPYAVEDAGGGVFNVLIYDNNFPKVTRAIKIDRNANTWSYDAATNPQNPSELYQGDATTKTIDLEPTSAGVGPQPCPFCGNVGTPEAGGRSAAGKLAAQANDDLDLIYLDGNEVDHAHLLIKDESGHKIGYENGNFVNDMPGADAQFVKASQNYATDIEPDYYVPDGHKYAITVDGSALEDIDETEVGVIGPAWDVAIDNLQIDPKGSATLLLTPDVENIAFSSTGEQTPDIEIGVSDDVDYAFGITDVTVPAGSALNIALPVDGGTFTLSNAPAGSYNLTVDRFDDNGELNFKHDGVALESGDTAALQYGQWSAKDQPMTLEVTRGGSTNPQSLDNQA